MLIARDTLFTLMVKIQTVKHNPIKCPRFIVKPSMPVINGSTKNQTNKRKNKHLFTDRSTERECHRAICQFPHVRHLKRFH